MTRVGMYVNLVIAVNCFSEVMELNVRRWPGVWGEVEAVWMRTRSLEMRPKVCEEVKLESGDLVEVEAEVFEMNQSYWS